MGPFAIPFGILTIWRLIAISTLLVKYTIFAKIATFKRVPLPPYLIFVNNLAIARYFCHFRQNRHFQKGPFAISFGTLLTIWRLFAISAIFAKYAILAKIATFSISFDILLTILRFFAISAIVTKYVIFA